MNICKSGHSNIFHEVNECYLNIKKSRLNARFVTQSVCFFILIIFLYSL